ncbi:hypothetical protein [Marinomonas sp. THO17]|uniref:hypothetical protein n=1 Tax=Marinomonas sp. THO17 TaxID=3149048 RepID=UPI00336BCBD8
MNTKEIVDKWHVPLWEGQRLLGVEFDHLNSFGLNQDDIPLIVKLVENPNYDYLPGFDIFHGSTDLRQHDYIHLVLGRGIHATDEAFVLGFTAGSTNRVTSVEKKLYTIFAKHLFPKEYRLKDDEIQVYRDAVKLGYISDCQPLDKVDFESMREMSIKDVRKAIGLEEDLLSAYFAIEKRRYPDNPASCRNI